MIQFIIGLVIGVFIGGFIAVYAVGHITINIPMPIDPDDLRDLIESEDESMIYDDKDEDDDYDSDDDNLD